jgi:hypothetical protein
VRGVVGGIGDRHHVALAVLGGGAGLVVCIGVDAVRSNMLSPTTLAPLYFSDYSLSTRGHHVF